MINSSPFWSLYILLNPLQWFNTLIDSIRIVLETVIRTETQHHWSFVFDLLHYIIMVAITIPSTHIPIFLHFHYILHFINMSNTRTLLVFSLIWFILLFYQQLLLSKLTNQHRITTITTLIVIITIHCMLY